MNARTRARIGVLKRKIAEARKQQRNAEKAGQHKRAEDAEQKKSRLEHELLTLTVHGPQTLSKPKTTI